jgi:hypothetical protein
VQSGDLPGENTQSRLLILLCSYPQVRLDFLNLNLAQPDGNGNCVTDSLVVSGSASNVPIICGENSGQHIYVNFNGDSDIILMISTGVLASYARSWNIKITQLACDCPSLGEVPKTHHTKTLTRLLLQLRRAVSCTTRILPVLLTVLIMVLL